MKKVFSFIGNTIKWLLIIFLITSIGMVVLYKYVPVPVSPLMVIRVCQQIGDNKEIKLAHDWVPLDSMSPNLPLAVMSSEDQNFFKHNGFDIDAINQALKEKRETGRERGASTISQQTAKNVFLWPESSWLRKGIEAYFTVLIETFWDKHRIMEVYLNTIEMGDGIYGAQAVAQEHFGRSADQLTREQCALIAATLPNPLRFDSSHPSRYMNKRQGQIVRQMRNLGHFPTREEAEEMGK